MRCLGCFTDTNSQYCAKCSAELFDGKPIQKLSFNPKEFNEYRISTNARMSISGVQDKISLKLVGDELVPTEKGGEYILKPIPSTRFNNSLDIVANEHLCMQLSRRVFNIPTAVSGIIKFKNGEDAYITRRFDYTKDGKKLDQEDFASILDMTSETHGENYKYNSSYELIAKTASAIIPASAMEIEDFYRRVVFDYLIGNGDAHLKNFSLCRYEGGRGLGFTPNYDLLCTRIHINEVFGDMALDLFSSHETKSFEALGFYSLEDFEVFGQMINIPDKRLVKIYKDITASIEPAKEMISKSFLSDEGKKIFLDLFSKRFGKALCYTIPSSSFSVESKIKPVLGVNMLSRNSVYFKIERDNDDEGTFATAFSKTEKTFTGSDLSIAHLHVPDEAVTSDGRSYKIGDINVSPSYRRNGIASKLVKLMSEHLGAEPTGASSLFSKEGKMFWEGLQKEASLFTRAENDSNNLERSIK
jgi:serine/threonine-protein kinase HipA